MSLGSSGLGLVPSSGSARSIPSVAPCSRNTGRAPRGTKMSERSTPPPLESASYVEVSLAKISPTPEGELASTGTVPDSGPSSLASFAFYDPASSLLRTCQRSLDGEWGEYSETCPSSGTMRSGRLYAHPTWALHTAENESSLWPTPDASVANDGESGESLESWKARREREKAKGQNGNGMGMPLAIAARSWPTATAADARASGAAGYSTDSGRPAGVTLTDAAVRGALAWPTPQARDEKGPTGVNNRLENGGRRSSLSDSAMPGATAGRLNPAWVEALMGFPPGWTDGLPAPPKRSTTGSRRERSPALPSTDPHDSEPSETPSSRSAPRQDPGEGSSK